MSAQLSKDQKAMLSAVLGAPQSSIYKDIKGLLLSESPVPSDLEVQEILSSFNNPAADDVDLDYEGRRQYLPLESYSPSALWDNRSSTISRGNGIIGTVDGPRYIGINDKGVYEYGPTLESMGNVKLAKNSSEGSRTKFALDVFTHAPALNLDIDPSSIESRAARKYEMINAHGKESHHMYPIEYSGRIVNALNDLGIVAPVLQEMVERKLQMGDSPRNLAAVQTKTESLGPSRYLAPTGNANNVDIHDRVHAAAERMIRESGIPTRYPKPGKPGSIEEFMSDPTISEDRKIAYALAVPQMHRAAMVQQHLGGSSSPAASTRVLNELGKAAALGAIAANNNPYTDPTYQPRSRALPLTDYKRPRRRKQK